MRSATGARTGLSRRSCEAARTLLVTLAALLLSGVFTGLHPEPARAVNLVAIGSVHELITAADLEAGPGTDLADFKVTGKSEVKLHVLATRGAEWRLSARLQRDYWPEEYSVSVRRTSQHDEVDGAELFTALDESPVQLMAGVGNVQNIHLQVRIGGVSLEDLPGLFASQIVFEVETLGER